MGRELAEFLRPGDVVGLVGDLGAGKTTLVQGVVSGLDPPEGLYVNSPTFTIVNEYPARIPVRHFDFYRIQDSDELFETGYMDEAGGIRLIEWLDAVPEAREAADERLEIQITESARGRVFLFTAIGGSWRNRLDGWERAEAVS